MAVYRQWVKNCFDNLVDPDKDAEVTELAQLLHEGIVKRRQSSVLAEVLGDRSCKQRSVDQAKVKLYEKFLARAWSDRRV